MKGKQLNSRQLKNLMVFIGRIVSLLQLFGVVFSAVAFISKRESFFLVIGMLFIAFYLGLGALLSELDYRVSKKLYKEEAEKALREVFPEIIREIMGEEMPKIVKENFPNGDRK